MHPMLSSLTRHKVVACMLIIEIAMVFGVLANAANVYISSVRHTDIPSGIQETGLIDVWLDNDGTSMEQATRAGQDMALLRRIPGIEAVVSTSSPPLTGAAWTQQVRFGLDQPDATLEASSFGGEGLLETMRAQLVAGRLFVPSDFVDQDGALSDTLPTDSPMRPHVAVIPQALAERLWPKGSALGKVLYFGRNRLTVVGVIKHFAQPDHLERGPDLSVIMPFRMTVGLYVVRAAPGHVSDVIREIRNRILASQPGRIIIQARPWAEDRDAYFSADKRLASAIVSIVATLVIVTASGIGGLTMFWVAQRQRQIGIRRAMGARRGDIARYFHLENLVLVVMGLSLGCVPVVAISEALFRTYGMARVSFLPSVAVAIVILLVGQVSALAPAVRASRVSPSSAMQRS